MSPGRNTKEVCVPDGVFKGLSLVGNEPELSTGEKKKKTTIQGSVLIKALQGSKGQVM